MAVYAICYLAAYFLARWEQYYLSGAVLLAVAAWLYYSDYRKTKNIIHLRALFSLFWIGGQGLSCLKLSHLQTDWSLMTWICLALAYAGFWAVFEILTALFGTTRESYGRRRSFSCNSIPLFHIICGLTAISLAAFVLEAVKLGYVPLFLKGVPHAYSEFHLTGVHYITVSCVLVPSLAVLFFHTERGWGSERRMAVSYTHLTLPTN